MKLLSFVFVMSVFLSGCGGDLPSVHHPEENVKGQNQDQNQSNSSGNSQDPDAAPSDEMTNLPKPEDNPADPKEELDIPSEWAVIKEVCFTEIVTDPQQDWNDSSGGNGIAFDAAPGNGTIGTTDEWLELYNGREEVVDLSDWRLQMQDGTDVEEILGKTLSALVFSKGGTVATFLPGEFLVMGNPQGDMKNEITLRLIDAEDVLIDEALIEDGNAASFDDESLSWNLDVGWKKGKATIGF